MTAEGQVKRLKCRACGATNSCSLMWESANLRDGLPYRGAYWRCSGCSSGNLDPVPTVSELTKAYDTTLVSPLWRGDRRAGLRKLLRRLIANPHEAPGIPPARGATILDVGCGSGAKLAFFQQVGWSCYGVDISPREIENAAQIVPADHLYAGSLRDAPFSISSFDVVRSDNVVEHLVDPFDELTRMFQLLKPGGQLFLYVPHVNGLTVRLFAAGSILSWIPFHLTLFSSGGLLELLSRAGFSNIRVTHYTPPDWIPLSVAQSARLRGRSESFERRVSSLARMFAHPVGIVAAAAGFGDELVARAVRS
jgi:SAM-dependent methyltransferase